MAQLLAGDIGGTKTILRLVETDGEILTTLHEHEYPSKAFPDLTPMVQAFLAEAPGTNTPAVACFAIAGPVVNQTSKLTNLGWSLSADRLTTDLNLKQVSLINDFAAVGYGILGLKEKDIHVLQTGQAEINAPIAVLGAGTGLGQGFLTHDGTNYQVFSSEGGHADFAPRSLLEFDLSRYLMEKNDIGRISVERVVSGQGIVSIYQFLRDRQMRAEGTEVGAIVTQWESEMGRAHKTVDPAAAISQAAAAKSDRLSEQTMECFIAAYGAEAGNLALKLLPYGGLYIAGGIAAKNLQLISETNTFLNACRHKGRMRALVERMPINIILNPQVGLIGAAVRASRML
ncbi:glucokinase [filamentous cyanobacterium LEGE 11480]|uniref:Glucokinase n=1 Tax=Romeriopsis navalis LEGE 11480 TaxID=2777977 RepID=A0A928Z0D4_9CYAN|nr:glucokinase [Romeriopsis navalis]MBE9028156.1 glucokinase [Romeriopsis navalis LEGE 11480]